MQYRPDYFFQGKKVFKSELGEGNGHYDPDSGQGQFFQAFDIITSNQTEDKGQEQDTVSVKKDISYELQTFLLKAVVMIYVFIMMSIKRSSISWV